MAEVRYPTQEQAAIEFYGRDGVKVSAVIRDISRSGACLQWDETPLIATGDLLRMTVILHDLRKEHRVNAEVVWSNGLRSGVQFLNSRELLDRMIAKD